MANGKIVRSGDKSLALELEQRGYSEMDDLAVSELVR
jgi:Fe-S cluster assembly ATPase SufC